ncbi:MAG: putative glycoside hydrolase [Oscillospiraceae bacterium]|nr:putative glycoside hydrolase [Oscillospiraceae bacterium]
MGRPKEFYRGKRRYRWIITALLFLAAVLVILAAWLFYYMQQFVVYDKDGAHIRFDSSETSADTSSASDAAAVGSVDTEIVVDAPDYSEVYTGAGENLDNIRALYVRAEGVSAANLNYYASSAASGGANALLVQLKAEDGQLMWLSGLPLAVSYGLDGTEELAASFASAGESLWLAAEISTLTDYGMATRNLPLALKNASLAAITDGACAWLDPYNDEVREYYSTLMTQLADMGFDEIVVSGLYLPAAEGIVYSEEMTATPENSAAVSSFALWLRSEADELGLRLSARCETEALRGGTSAELGQRLELFWAVFDRIYIETTPDYFASDVQALEAALGGSDGARIVPIEATGTPSTESWAVG